MQLSQLGVAFLQALAELLQTGTQSSTLGCFDGCPVFTRLFFGTGDFDLALHCAGALLDRLETFF